MWREGGQQIFFPNIFQCGIKFPILLLPVEHLSCPFCRLLARSNNCLRRQNKLRIRQVVRVARRECICKHSLRAQFISHNLCGLFLAKQFVQPSLCSCRFIGQPFPSQYPLLIPQFEHNVSRPISLSSFRFCLFSPPTHWYLWVLFLGCEIYEFRADKSRSFISSNKFRLLLHDPHTIELSISFRIFPPFCKGMLLWLICSKNFWLWPFQKTLEKISNTQSRYLKI